MHFPFLPHAGGPKSGADKDTLVPLHEQEHNTSEGGEFLDDAIRMDDESPIEQEKSGNIVEED
ncbi:hypothetical protein [Chitinophaga sp. Ak27]|uniref:hypothetical protein n=1 Tax=Chitinophaga sp. Ak27 TaxID=2726116 RepID=UPI00145E2E0F|nr:hypothetical protein [Chitinophaga sp. Ak27]NLU91865.1 hypothetical protein [Chitinophaga sp. Ak27]